MTIKQQGGIFGRNPSFNTVTADSFVGPVTGSITGDITTDLISEETPGNGVVVDGVTLKDGALNATATSTIGRLVLTTGATSSLSPNTDGTNLFFYARDGSGNYGGAGFDAGSAFAFRADTTGRDLGVSWRRWNNLYLSGNVNVSAGSGIDFSATSGTGTSELFDDYEEGTWTPTTAGDATGALTGAEAGTYTKVGRLVHVQFQFAVNTSFSSNLIGGLPYTPYIQSSISSLYGAVPVNTSSGNIYAVVQDTSTNILFYSDLAGTTHNPNTTSTFYRVALSYVTS